MAAGKTYEPISTQTVGTAVASVTFSSIPQTYTDLILITAGATAGGAQMTMRINGATTNYESVVLSGNSNSVDGRRITGLSYIQLGYHDYFAAETLAITQINKYSDTNTHKTVLNKTNNGNQPGVGYSVGLHPSTSAITTFDVLPLNSTWSSGTTFTLYGIKEA
jgi:hypothetical protein